jgi:hypothetical protein
MAHGRPQPSKGANRTETSAKGLESRGFQAQKVIRLLDNPLDIVAEASVCSARKSRGELR